MNVNDFVNTCMRGYMVTFEEVWDEKNMLTVAFNVDCMFFMCLIT